MKLLIPIFFLLFSTYGVLFGQWNNANNNYMPVCVAADTQYNIQVVSDGGDGSYIAWEDKRSGRWRVYIQYVNANGQSQWIPNGIPVCSDTSYQKRFEIQSDGLGGVFIVWEDRRSGANIFAQRINNSGNLLWGSSGINVNDTLNSYYPKIDSDPNGNLYVTWYSVFSLKFETEVFVQKFNSAGNKLWGSRGTRLTTLDRRQSYSQLISTTDGGAIVTWVDERNGNCIYAQKVDNIGVPQWTANGVTVSTNSSTLYRNQQRIISNNNGGAYIAWENTMAQFGPSHIFVQNINFSGSKLWGSNGIAVGTGGEINYEISLAEYSGGIFMSWNYVDSGPYTVARIQKIDQSGNKLWGTDGINVCPISNTFSHIFDGLVSDGKNGVIVASFDTRNDINDVYAHRFNSFGNRVWDSLGVAVGVEDSSQFFPGIAKTNSGVMIAWEDWISGQGDIYCQGVLDNGTLTNINHVSNITPSSFSLAQNYPNPFNPSTKISFDIPKHSNVKLSVYNSLGQQVAQLVDEQLSPGSYEYSFVGTNLASGMYFYTLETERFKETKKMILLK